MTLAKYNILWELKEGISLPWEVIDLTVGRCISEGPEGTQMA